MADLPPSYSRRDDPYGDPYGGPSKANGRNIVAALEGAAGGAGSASIFAPAPVDDGLSEHGTAVPARRAASKHRRSASSNDSGRPYSLIVEHDLVDPLPVFWLLGTGDLRALASRTGIEFDRETGRYRCPTPYHARLVWCYADPEADAALSELFPRLAGEKPTKPRYAPYVVAANDRVICLTTPETNDRARAAHFTYNRRGHYWETRDLRRVLALVDIAEEDLARRLEALAALPFDGLSEVDISDLMALPEPQPGATPAAETVSGTAEGPRQYGLLRYDREREMFVCRHAIAKGAGFVPLPGGGYGTRDFEQAQQLRHLADDGAELVMQVEAMIRTIPDPMTPDPRPVPEAPNAPFPFAADQLEGIRFAATRRGSFIGDEMGVGKTAEAIGLINLERPRLALVLVPANLLDNWLQECALYLAPPNVAAIFGRDASRARLPAGVNVIIASYEMLPKLPVLHDCAPDLLICDEAQEIKSEESKAGSVVYSTIAPSASRLVFMTGTPIWNRTQDLWAPLHALAPAVFPHKQNFMRLYRINDPTNLTEEQAAAQDFMAHLLRSGLMIRRKKEEVLNSLPPKVHTLVPVPVPPEMVEEIRRREPDIEEVEGTKPQSAPLSALARLRREVGEAKYGFVRDYILEFMHRHRLATRSRPPVVFGRHRHLVRRLAEDLKAAGASPITLIGGGSTTARQKMVNEFQAGRFDCVLAGIEAAGVGYTMTRSADVFIFEIDWTPGLMKQPIDRIHRRGQDRQCNVYWFVIDGTIDAHIARLFSAKDQRAQSTLGDHLVGMFSPIALRDHRVHAFFGA